ncbi:MAG: hypothetical protein IIC73_01010 [Armatimonadetes bacterium]|nr:hypothetical protein [Armatimonadota bacterium]
MRRSISLIALIAVCATGQAQGIDKNLTLQLASHNMFRGSILTDGTVFQPKLDLGLSSNTLLTTRGSYDVNGSERFDDWSFSLAQRFDAVLFSGTFGAILYERDNGLPDTSEVFVSAAMKWPMSMNFSLHKDIDVVNGLYVRATTAAGLPKISVGGVRASVTWKGWLGYSESKHAKVYYGHRGAGFADLGARITASFGVSSGTATAWAQVTTLVDPDYRSPNGDRSAFTVGASFAWRF